MPDSWKPWDLPVEGPPCARLRCTFWKPMFIYNFEGSVHEQSDGFRCCHATEQHRDFSCYKPRTRG